MSADPRRVWVTGVGVVSAFGRGLRPLADGLRSGASAVRPLHAFDAGTLPIQVAAQVDEVLPQAESFVDDRKANLALAAAQDASAGVDLRHAGVWLGTGLSSVTPMELEQDIGPYLRADGTFDRAAICSDLSRHHAAPNRHLPERVTGLLAAHVGATGPQHTSFSACAAGALAIGHAARAIRRGEVDRALAGGHDAMIHPLGVLSFLVLGALAPGWSRPFDVRRDGFVIGEGAAVLLLESAASARARGAAPLAEVLGMGSSVDAHNVTAPHPDGRGAELAMRRALRESGVDRVDHVNAHGTGTPLGDRAEAAAVARVLGADVPVLSIKGAVGHCIAAAGAVEAAATVAALHQGFTPGTAGLEQVDALGVRVAREPSDTAPRVVLSNSFGFGGQNCSLVLGRVE